MESEPQVDTTSLLSRQPSGIRAIPSHDDDDDDEFDVENDNSPGKMNKIDETNKNSITSSSNGSSDSSSFASSGGNNGSYVNGEEEFETPIDGPDNQTLEKLIEVDETEAPASGSALGSPGVRAPKAGLPVAKVSDDGDDDDDGEIEVDSEEEDISVVGDGMGRSYGAEKAPRVRVLGEEEEEEEDESFEEAKEELGDEGTQEKSELESLETKDVVGDEMGSKVEENASESRDGELVNEEDSVVDSIKVDAVEAVRSGVAVVGVEDDNKQDSKVESVDTVAGDTEKEVDAKVEVGEEETSVVEEPALADSASVEDSGVKLTEEGDSVVDSINVDAGEAVRSGAAIVGEVKEEKESGDSGTDENAVVEEFLSTVEGKDSGSPGTVGENTVVEESSSTNEGTAAELPDEIDSKSVETGEAKVTDEGDAVVDAVNVDVVEAVRSGVAVVGGSDVGTETDIKERSDSDTAETKVDNSAVEEPASTKEDSVREEPAKTDSKSMKTDEAKVTDEGDLVVDEDTVGIEPVKSGVAVREDPGAAGTEMKAEVKEVEAPAGENATLANDNHANSSEIVDNSDKKALANEAKTPASEEINAEAAESKQHESTGGMQSVSGGDQEKVQHDDVDDDASDKIDDKIETLIPDKGDEAEERFYIPQEEYDEGSDGEGEPLFFKSEISSRNFMEELASGDRSEMIDGQVVTDSEEEAESDEEGEGRELIDSAALAALLKAATSSGSDTGPITITSQDGSRLFSVERPAGLGTSLRSVRPASNSSNSSIFAPPSAAAPSEESLSDEDKKKLQKIQDLRVKFLRLVQRIGQTVDQSVSSQVLYKLAILAGRTTVPSFSLDNAKQTAMQLEAEGKDDLDFSLNLLVLGKSGVGKSATINSIFGEEKVKINAFEPETTSVNEVCGVVDGVKIRVIDAPGLKPSALEQAFNRKVLASVKKFTKRYPPDLTLYVDRLDSQTRDLNDLPMLRTISNSLGSSIWRSTILTLTHAACAPPDGPTGTSIGYEVFVGQRSHVIQQSIGQAVGDLRFMNLGMMNPVSLVENHPACRKNRDGLKVLPNGQAWRPQLMLLCYSLKILADASLTSKPQDPVDHRKFFNFRTRSPPLPYLLSSLLQPRTHPKLSADQGGDNGDSDVDLDDLSDSDQEEDEYDQLPPFKPLRKTQIAKLSREQKKAYFEEYDYRVKLLQRKQLREELKRMRDMKKNGKPSMDEYSEMPEDYDGENGAPAAVPVPLPDMVLPPSFDSDTPAYRYRFLEPTSQFLARPVLDTHGWDHDCGYDGVNVEQNLGIAGRFPAAVTVQVTKDKKDFNIHLDSAVSAKHGENGSSLVGFDIQTIGKQLAYIVRGESKFKNLKKNKTAAGVSVTFLGENVATGVKLEDQIALGKRLVLVGSTGTVRSQKDAAYGANLEIRLREEDYPIGQDQSSFVLSLMKWRGDLAIGGNLQSQISVGRGSKMAVRVALNNKQSGQITVRTSSSDHVALAYAGLIPIALAIYRKFRPSVSENYSIY
ncbi:translocase of chloroplast 159, chloroplastic-like [Chenopodium quinoa]|uniref:translocase of chloroplast 159, chloroplastic-like n=1 Tax=Chenopodium quinoa TaxID=63459 RepID=UPI000B789F7F|nr:translocase of chloroplast 159, chloroplastic-like [Chenopodium quinoa]